MPAEFRCPTCRHRFTPPRGSGKQADCPECGELLELDLPADEPEPAAPKKKPARADREDDDEPRPRRSRKKRSAPSDGAGKVLLALGGVVGLVAVLGVIGWAVWRFSGGTAEFKEFRSAEGGFAILLPGTPTRKDQDSNGLHLTMHAVERRNSGYAVGYADARGTPLDLDGAVRGMAQKGNGTAQSTGGNNLVGGWREFEIATADPKGFVSGRVVAARGRFYMYFAFGKDAQLSNPDVRRFIDSFKLTDGPPPWEAPPAPAQPAPAVTPPRTQPQPQPKQPEPRTGPGTTPPSTTPPNTTPPSIPPPPVPPVAARPKASRDEILGFPLDPEFREPAPAGGLLVGFHVGLTRFTNYAVIGSMRPIYRVGEKEELGQARGKKSELGTRKVVAKPGYAVGAISVRTGLGIDGFSVTFMKVKDDGKLDPKDAYESEWLGNKTGGSPGKLTGDGTPVVGLLGREARDAITAIGLMFQGKEGAGNGR